MSDAEPHDAQPVGLAAISVQRGDRLMFRLFHEGEVGADCLVRLAFAGKGKASVAPGAVSAPEALDQIEASVRAQAEGRALPTASLDFEYVVPEGVAVMATAVKVRRGERYVVAPYVEGWSMAVRMPRNKAEFRHHLAFRHHRHEDIETVYRAALDLLAVHTRGKSDPALRPYAVNAYVIGTYKAVEMGLAESGTRRFAADVMQMVDAMPPSRSMREDCDIARLSVHSADWHYAVHTGDDALLEQALAGVEAICLTEREQHITFVYNACKGLVLYALLKSFEDGRASARLFYLVYTRFRAAVATHTTNAGWFKELTVPMTCSVVALQARPMVRAGEALPNTMVKHIATLAPRVRTPAFQQKLAELIERRRAASPEGRRRAKRLKKRQKAA